MLNKLNPYMTAIKLAGIGLVLLGIIAFIWSWHSRGQEIEKLTEMQDSIVQAATLATVPADEKGRRALLQPSQVPAAIAGLKSSLDSADSALDVIGGATVNAKNQAVVADSALLAENERLRKQFAKAEAKITQLDSRRPEGSIEEQCRLIEEDSKAAWEF